MTPLAGTRVLDLSRYLPGAYCTFLLQSLGAEVVKVEPPAGDPMRFVPPLGTSGVSRLFAMTCAGKKSVRADLRDPQRRAAVLELAASCAVVVESYRPGVAERLGVGYADVRAVRPDVVYASVQGFPRGSALEQVSGHDLNYLSLAGWLEACEGPGVSSMAPGDLLGGLFAAFSVLAAVGEEPRGRHVETSIYAAALSWLLVHAAAGDRPLPSQGDGYRLVNTRDGQASLAALEPHLWNRLCEVLGIPEARADSAAAFVPDDHFRATRPLLDRAFAGLDREGVVRVMHAAGAVTPVLTPAQALAEPSARDCGVVRGAGDALRLAPPLPVELGDAHVPEIGEHDDLLPGATR